MSLPTLAVLFDLDETLVLTNALEALRKRRNWPVVYARFSETELPPTTLAFIGRLRALPGVVLGVVTKTPRPYAEKLLKFHGIDIPVLVAYHDVSRQKPYPDSLIKAAQKVNLPIQRCIYIGDHPDDIAAAAVAHCVGIAVCWTENAAVPGACGSWDTVYDLVIQRVERHDG